MAKHLHSLGASRLQRAATRATACLLIHSRRRCCCCCCCCCCCWWSSKSQEQQPKPELVRKYICKTSLHEERNKNKPAKYKHNVSNKAVKRKRHSNQMEYLTVFSKMVSSFKIISPSLHSTPPRPLILALMRTTQQHKYDCGPNKTCQGQG